MARWMATPTGGCLLAGAPARRFVAALVVAPPPPLLLLPCVSAYIGFSWRIKEEAANPAWFLAGQNKWAAAVATSETMAPQ
jgi:hypothetical protein